MKSVLCCVARSSTRKKVLGYFVQIVRTTTKTTNKLDCLWKLLEEDMYRCSEVESSHQSACEMNAVECSDSSLETISSSLNTMETGLNKLYAARRARECGTGFLLTLTLLSVLASPVNAWGNSNSNSNTAEPDESVYGNKFTQDWLYDSKSLSIIVDGCVWGNVADSEDSGCLEDESEDGTTNWYMMANCRRPQVAFRVYGSSSSGSSCNSNTFKGSVSQKKRAM